jgi:hypothetical protein
MNGAKGGTSLYYSKGTPESCADSKNPVVKHSEGRKETSKEPTVSFKV